MSLIPPVLPLPTLTPPASSTPSNSSASAPSPSTSQPTTPSAPSPSTPADPPPSQPQLTPPSVVPPPLPIPSPPQSSPSMPAATPPNAPPKSSPSPPEVTPPPSDKPPATVAAPPHSPQSSQPSDPSPPAPPAPLPVVPTEKPTARPTTRTGNSTVSSSSSGGLNAGTVGAVGVVVGLVALTLLIVTVWIVRRRKRKDSETFIGYSMPSAYSSPQDVAFFNSRSPAPKTRSASGNSHMYSQSDSGVVSGQRSWYTYDELAKATDGFSKKNLLGEGGFGCVYKGVLEDGKEVAVKQLKIGGSQGDREFRAEVEIITRVHHRHLVTLVGYCILEQHRLLVYDYVPNNTLHYHLHADGRPVMTWATRVKVGAGAARGIAYLHEDCYPRIIHRDIKSSNILLDNSFEALVADFGLAKIAQELDSNTHVSTRVMGTFGYVAPEYATTGKLTEKSDVYSFGVVLLELITGRRPVDASRPLGDESLVEWARPLLARAIEHEDFEELVDRKLGNNYVPDEMLRMIEAAAASVRHSAAKRPKMSQVVRALDTLEEATDITNGMKPGQSQMFDSRQQSAQIRMFQRMAFDSQDCDSDFTQNSRRSRDYDHRDYYGGHDHGRRDYGGGLP